MLETGGLERNEYMFRETRVAGISISISVVGISVERGISSVIGIRCHGKTEWIMISCRDGYPVTQSTVLDRPVDKHEVH